MAYVTARRRRFAVLLAGSLVAGVGAVGGNIATAVNTSPATTSPVAIVVDGIRGADVTSDLGSLPPGAAPAIFVEVGQTFHVDVSFRDEAGTPVPFNTDTVLEITATSNSGPVALLPSSKVTVPKGNARFDLPLSISKSVNRVVLTVKIAKGPGARTVAPGSSYVPGATPVAPPVKDLRFDVVLDARTEPGNVTDFAEGIGGDTNCVNATTAAPVCGIVLLPRGAGAKVLLSVGACDTEPSTYAPCRIGPKGPGGAVVQTLFSQPSIPYDEGSPAAILLKCDKTLCGTGAISNLTILYSLSGNGALTRADPCPAKNTMAAPRMPCVDYVQSKRDGSADTHLVLLTDVDIRTGIG
jgi:hypothetical protein